VTPLDRAVVWRKLDVITRDVALLAPAASLSLDAYRADVMRMKAIERLLQEAIEAASDVCAYLLRAGGLPRPATVHDTFVAAGRARLLPPEVAAALAPAAGLRNRLVHEYDDLDDAQVLASVGAAVRLLPQFAAAVARSLGED
jgi:uncharacterized protein YutE (UPF0331/DUF86 family)